MTERCHTRAFIGVETRWRDGEEDEDDDASVYVTRTGRVYHTTLSCTYLTLSISQVKVEDLSYLRSEGGGIYYACESCVGESVLPPGQPAYICNYGDRYHRSNTCPRIRRSIQEIKKSEVGSRRPCSKCGE